MSTPHELIKKVQEKALQFVESRLSLTEAETKQALINPIFEAIGWDMGNPTVVRMEWKKDTGDRWAVDYAFIINDKPKLLVEAERLRENITDKKWSDQLLWYSSKLGVKWCALTNGNIIRIYNSLAEEEAADKLLFEIEIKTIDTPGGIPIDAFMEKLSLLSEKSLKDGKIGEVWDNIYTIREVFDYLKEKKEDLIDDIVKSAKLTKKSVGEVLDQIIHLRGSFLEEEQEVEGEPPWLTNGKKWHLVNRLKSKSMEQLSDAAKRLVRLNEIISSALPDVTGPHWSKQDYITFKVKNTNWLDIVTSSKTFGVYIKCNSSQFLLEDLSERLAVKVFDSEAKFSEKLKLPSSIQERKDGTGVILRIKSKFDLENEEFKKFLEEAYKSFVKR